MIKPTAVCGVDGGGGRRQRRRRRHRWRQLPRPRSHHCVIARQPHQAMSTKPVITTTVGPCAQGQALQHGWGGQGARGGVHEARRNEVRKSRSHFTTLLSTLHPGRKVAVLSVSVGGGLVAGWLRKAVARVAVCRCALCLATGFAEPAVDHDLEDASSRRVASTDAAV